MTGMSMEYAALADAISEVRRVEAELDQGRTVLHRSFGGFLGGGWTGQAADSFRGGWDDWSAGVGEVLSSLSSIADLLEQHGRELRGLDDVVQGNVDGLHSRLGGTGGQY
jgi:WXG100 family type VII secretion target